MNICVDIISSNDMIVSRVMSFSYHQHQTVFHRSLWDNNYFQVIVTHKSILSNLTNADFCLDSILLLISNSTSLFFLNTWGLFQARRLLMVSLFHFFYSSLASSK